MITYGSTTLTSYNTITKIEVYYYKSTSATSLSGGSWSTTKPTWENGKYIWQKIRTTYEGKLENGQYYSESDPVNITGQQGQTGTAAYSYKLNASDTSITVSKDGTYSKTSVTFSATSKQGTGTVNAYAGWFKIETTVNGTTWTTQYTSSENESSKEFTIPTGILNIRCSLYQADGTSVLLDIVSVAIVKDGTDGTDGTTQNLLLDVYATSLNNVKAPWKRYLSDVSNTTITGEFIAESNLPDPNATHFYRITDSSASIKGRGLCFYNGGTPPFINGHTYRIGCWVRNHSGKPRLYIALGSIGEWLPHKTIENTEWEWMECVRTFGETDPSIASQSNTYKRIYFYLYNNNVADSSLDMCGFKIEEIQTDISTARNYLLKTEKLEGWGVTGGATISNGVATFPEVTASTWREIYPTKNFKYEAIRNKNIIFSVRVKANTGDICACNLCIGVDATETAYNRQKYRNNFVYFTGDGEWHTICAAMPISDELFNGGSGTPDYDNCWVTVRIGTVNIYHNSFQVKEPQFSLGTTATAWSSAPEDVNENLQQVQDNLDNLEIGGRNLLLDTATERISPASSNSSAYVAPVPMMSDYASSILNNRDDYFTYSFDYEVTGNEASDAYIYVQIRGSTVPSASDGYYSYVLENPTGKHCCTFKLTEAQATGDSLYCGIRLRYATNGAILRVWNIKLERGTRATDWTPAPEDAQAEINTALSQSIWYATCDTAGDVLIKEATITPTVDNFVLNVGTTVNVKFESANTGDRNSLKLNVNNTGDKDIRYMNNATMVAIPSNGYIIAGGTYLFVYDGTYWVIQNLNYNTNDNYYDRRQHKNNITAVTAITAKHLIVGTSAGYKQITSTSGGSLEFDLGYPILWAYSAIKATETSTATYEAYPSVNFSTSGTIQDGAANKMLWLKGTITGTIFKLASSNFLTTKIPNQNDDMYYIPLGIMSSATTGYFSSSNRIYAYVDDEFQPLDNAAILRAAEAKKTATNYMSSDNTGIMVADLKDGEQLPANATGGNVFITAGYGEGEAAVDMGVHIRDGQEDLAIYGETTRIGKENDSNVSIDNNGIIINKGSKELAKYSSKGITFDEETPYKIGNDNSYIAFEDTDNDNIADSLSIVADSIYFRDTANTNIKDTLNGLQSDLAIAQEDIDLKNNYIKINTSEPSIVISASSNTNDTNLKLESSQLSFQIDGQTTATITNDQMNIPTASVTNLFIQSTNTSTNTVYEKVWVMRTNGHLSLKTITRN